MKTEAERGGYSRSIVRLGGSFQTNATSAPTVLRDGHSSLVKGVVRDDVGLFTVTLNDHGVLPKRLVVEKVHLSASATPTVFANAKYVTGSYDQTARTFRIVVTTSAAVADPDTGSRIGFELVGSLSSAGTDAA